MMLDLLQTITRNTGFVAKIVLAMTFALYSGYMSFNISYGSIENLLNGTLKSNDLESAIYWFAIMVVCSLIPFLDRLKIGDLEASLQKQGMELENLAEFVEKATPDDTERSDLDMSFIPNDLQIKLLEILNAGRAGWNARTRNGLWSELGAPSSELSYESMVENLNQLADKGLVTKFRSPKYRRKLYAIAPNGILALKPEDGN